MCLVLWANLGLIRPGRMELPAVHAQTSVHLSTGTPNISTAAPDVFTTAWLCWHLRACINKRSEWCERS